MGDLDKIFTCKSLKPFTKIVDAVLKWGGISESMFTMCTHKNVQFLVKIYFHHKSSRELYVEPLGMNPSDAEIKILQIFKKNIIDKNYTPCILELAAYKTCKGVLSMVNKELDCTEIIRSPIKSTIDEIHYKFCLYGREIENDLAHDMVSYAVMELCEWPFYYIISRSLGTVADEAIFISLLFQLIHALYVINRIYPKFRHRDLHTGNVMLKVDNDFVFDLNNPQVLVLQAEGKKFYVPFFGIYVKIIDFGFSILPEENIISNIYHEKRRDINRSDHDMSWFFFWLDRNANEEHSSDATVLYIRGLIDALDPHGIYYNHDIEYINAHPELAPTYKDMINNPIFEDYLNRGKAVIYKQYYACDG